MNCDPVLSNTGIIRRWPNRDKKSGVSLFTGFKIGGARTHQRRVREDLRQYVSNRFLSYREARVRESGHGKGHGEIRNDVDAVRGLPLEDGSKDQILGGKAAELLKLSLPET